MKLLISLQVQSVIKSHEEIDIKALVDHLRLLTDSVKQLNKPYRDWSPLDIWQVAFPIVTYTAELLEILDREEQNQYSPIEEVMCG